MRGIANRRQLSGVVNRGQLLEGIVTREVTRDSYKG